LYSLVNQALIRRGIEAFNEAAQCSTGMGDGFSEAKESDFTLVWDAALADNGGLDLNAWYLDDGSLLGSKAALQWWVPWLQVEGPSVGIYLNLGASVIWSPDAHADLSGFPSMLSTCAGSGCIVLGAAVGSSVFVEEYVLKRVAKISAMIDMVGDLDDSTMEFQLLQQCVAMPRFNYQLRVVSPLLMPLAIAAFDTALSRGISSLFGNGSLRERDFARVSLPVASSGFGLCFAKDVAWSAHVGSLFDSISLQRDLLLRPPDDSSLAQHHSLSLASFNSQIPTVQHVTLNSILSSPQKIQHMLAEIFWKVKLAVFRDSCISPIERAFLAVGSVGGSGAWLFHRAGFGSRMPSRAWRAAALFRLGRPLFETSVACPSCAGSFLDIYGIHCTHCAGQGDATFRHNLVRDELARMCVEGRINHKMEVGYLLNDAVSGLKPADLLLHNWDAGRSLCVDVAVANSLEFVSECRDFVPMEPLIKKENDKFHKYKAACESRGLSLRPFIVGSLGGLTDGSSRLLKEIGAAISSVSGRPKSVVIAELRRRISYAVQRGQANAWLRRGFGVGVG
jgi:hypothetical protein